MGARPEPTILYVDDQPSHRFLFERAFRGDWLILTAASADEAFQVLEEHDVFLVISDHRMPGMTGIEFLEKVKEKTPETIRAILSAYSDPDLIKEARERANVAEYLRKPWKRDVIQKFIEHSFQRYLIGEPETETVEKKPITAKDLSNLVDELQSKPDERGKKRIFLTYVKPSLRRFVARVVRPCPDTIRAASAAAVKGNIKAVEAALISFLRDDFSAETESEPDKH